ncbi:MAG TPA: hypothetical protein VI546_06025, partial [candidate division Zixibacteria bacterium]|nr:hypothetical protein [candidate division Zixibacteria bacterium]
MRAVFDSINLGIDAQRIEIIIKGKLRVLGGPSQNDIIVFKSDRSPSGNPKDWFGIWSADSLAQIIVKYAKLLDAEMAVFTASPVIAPCSVLYSWFENWRNHAVAGTTESEFGTLSQAALPLSHNPDKLVVRGNVFWGRNEAMRFSHHFGAVIDSNQFFNQESLAVYFDDYAGTITRNYFFATNSINAVWVRGGGIIDG